MSLRKHLSIHRSLGSQFLVCSAAIAILHGGGFAAAANHESADTQGGDSGAESVTAFERMMARHSHLPSADEVMDSIQSGSLGKVASLTVLGKIPSPASELAEIPVQREWGIHENPVHGIGVPEDELMDAICRRRAAGYQGANVEPEESVSNQVVLEIGGITASRAQDVLRRNSISAMAEIPNPPVTFGLLVGISTLLSRRRIRRLFAVRSIRP